MSSSNKVRVGVRVRPQSERERTQGLCVSVLRAERAVIVGRDKQFTYNYVFGPQTQQEELYNECVRDTRRDRDLIKGVFDGYNATVFAYGQTGSGKTYTMGTAYMDDEQTMGIIPRAARDLFEEIDDRKYAAFEQGIQEPTFELSVQFIELYNEEIIDLLADINAPNSKIDIRECGDEVCLRGVVSRPVKSEPEVQDMLRAGIVNRSTASTNANENSSRSHAIFTITMKQTRVSEDDPNYLSELSGKFNFVDLAGSEGLRKTGAVGDRAREGIHINKGLLDLSCVITALHERASHIPYRNGKLTQLLKDSLGGNSRTLMIACVGPSELDISETVKTLNYAASAMNIRNKQSRHFRLVSNPATNCAGDAESSSTDGTAVPPLSDTANFPYSRSQWVGWYSELNNHLPAEPPQMDVDFMPPAAMADENFAELPQLGGPDDFDGIARIRQYFTTQIARRLAFDNALEENAKLLDAKLKQRLCLADLDRARVDELENEVRKMKSELSTKTRENRQLKRNYLAMECRLRANEAELENGRLQVERAKRYIDQERAPDKDARRTLHKLAEMFESPIPTTSNVARLRKKFGDHDEQEQEEDEEGANQRKMLKLVHPSVSATRSTVQFQDLASGEPQRYASRLPVGAGGGTAAYVNAKYQPRHRRSRSAGALRVLNHQPQHKTPLGTIFQPKLPKGVKHTTQPDAKDLKKHDEYLVTRQEVDAHGNLQTKLFKGQVAPTAGGGSAVVYHDVENLFQESPAADK